jgi:hypothetical protein
MGGEHTYPVEFRKELDSTGLAVSVQEIEQFIDFTNSI